MARRRRKLNWAPILWLATLINVSLGLAYSPITSAAKVRVVGAQPSDHERITAAIQGLHRKPALRGGAEIVIEQLYRKPDMRSVSFGQNLFRRALIELKYQPPVARIAGMPKTILTAQGTLCQTNEPIDALPELNLYPAALDPMATYGSSFEAVKLADVCMRAATLGIPGLTISALDSGAVCLNSGTTGRVALGPPDDLDAKFEALQKLLGAHPEVLTQNQEIVLLEPSKPFTRPMGRG